MIRSFRKPQFSFLLSSGGPGGTPAGFSQRLTSHQKETQFIFLTYTFIFFNLCFSALPQTAPFLPPQMPQMWRRLGDVPLLMESDFHAWIRGQNSHPQKVSTFLTLVVVCVITLPLLATGETSFQDAKGVCYDRNMAKLADFYEDEEWAFPDHATRVLFPMPLQLIGHCHFPVRLPDVAIL